MRRSNTLIGIYFELEVSSYNAMIAGVAQSAGDNTSSSLAPANCAIGRACGS